MSYLNQRLREQPTKDPTMSRTKRISVKTRQLAVHGVPDQSQTTYGLYMDGVLLTTPNGIPVTANNTRGLLGMCAEIDFSDVLDVTGINLYGMYSTEREFCIPNASCLGDSLHCWLAKDPVLQLCSGPREAISQWRYYTLVVAFLEEHGLRHPCFTQMPSVSGTHESWGEDEWRENHREIADLVETHLLGFTTTQSSAFLTAMTFLQSPIISLMLVLGRIRPMEAAYIFMAANCILSKIFPDVTRKEEKATLKSITTRSECIQTYLELFDVTTKQINEA